MNQKYQKFTSKDSRAKKYSWRETTSFRVRTNFLWLLDRARSSSIAEGNLEPEDAVEIETGDKKEKHNIRRLSVENFFIDITKNLVSIFYDPGSESFPIPLKYVDEMRLWTYYQGFMHRSEGVTLSGEWTGTARFKILRSWIPAGYTWVTGKTNENLDDYQTRQHMAWNLGNILQESQGNISCMMGRIKCHSASSTLSTEESTRYWPTAKITPKPLLVLVSNSKKDTAPALPCIEKDGGISGSCNINWCQRGTVRFRNLQEHAGKWSDSLWTTPAKKSMWEAFIMARYTSQYLFKKLWKYQKRKQQWISNGTKTISSVGCQESETKVGSHPSGEGGWKKKGSHCEFDGLSVTWRNPNLQDTSRNTRSRVDNVKDKEGYREAFAEHGASASQMAAAKLLDINSKFPGMAGETSDALAVHAQVKMIEAPRLLRSVTKWNKVCDTCLLRLRNWSNQTTKNTDNCAMWRLRLKIANWVYFKTLRTDIWAQTRKRRHRSWITILPKSITVLTRCSSIVFDLL